LTHLSDHATMVECDGEIIDTRLDGVHTSTQMGSGRFAGEGFSSWATGTPHLPLVAL
jgi:hypothetical protein